MDTVQGTDLAKMLLTQNVNQNTNDIISDEAIAELMKGENKLFDLQKEHLSNVRTLITAAAAIASVDLLAMQALQNIGIESWFLGSVVLLYCAAIVYVIYLNVLINSQTKNFIERGEMAENLTNIVDDINMPEFEKYKKILNSGVASMNKISEKMTIDRHLVKFLMFGNILFIIGLFVPILGFAISFFK